MDNLVITKYVDKSKVATTYTVKYQNAEGTDLKDAVNYDTYVGDTYTASSSDMATFYSDDTNTKYVYKTGNTSAEAVGTAASNVITLVFNEYSKIAYTVTAKNGETTLGTLASGNAYTDGSTTVYWNKFKQFGGQWYESTGSYGKTITAAGNTDVAFTASDIAYFFEAENLNTSRSGFPTASGTGYSGGSARRNYASGQMWTSAIAEGGTFILTFPYSMANASESTVVIKTRDAEGNYTETGHSLTASSAGKFSEVITIPAGSSVAICNDNGYNSNILVDYLTLSTKVTKTISSAGWSTYCSPYILDFSSAIANLDAAYIVTGGAGGVLTKTEVTGAVPAGTGLLLKGTASESVNIPVAAAATFDVSANKLEGVTASETLTANDGYVLMTSPSLAFYQNSKDFTLSANSAYLPAGFDGVGARSLYDLFGDETTGISAALNDKPEMINDKAFYNLQGQRVVAPQKGLYIVNGKKVIIK